MYINTDDIPTQRVRPIGSEQGEQMSTEQDLKELAQHKGLSHRCGFCGKTVCGAYLKSDDHHHSSAAVEGLKPIATEILTQDNRATANPIFAVQQRRRLYGLDTNYCEDVVWIDTANDCIEATPQEHERFEAGYKNGHFEPDGWSRTGYVDQWEFVTACFTEAGCKAYIEANGHNLKEPRIYVYGGCRNYEWQAIRAALANLDKE